MSKHSNISARLGAIALMASLPFAPALAGGPPTQAAEPEQAAPIDMNASWPCVQRKVDTLSAGTMWDGPPIDGIKGWYQDKAITALIPVLASRRVPLEKAEAEIKKFAEAQAADKRDAQLTLLFAGLFDKISSERRSILSGIEKYQKAQQERAKELENQTNELAKHNTGMTALEDMPADIRELNEKFQWAQRIFQERQQNIPLACELPVIVEERLYAIAQAIRGQMKS